MPTNPNMVAIQTVTVGSGGAANIEFTNIPQTYTDLYVVISTRTNRGSAVDAISVVVNSDTTAANYSFRNLFGTGGGAVGSNSFNTYLEEAAYTSGNGGTASTFGSASFYIPNYTVSQHKSISIDSVGEDNSTSTRMNLTAFIWKSNSAITALRFIPITGTLLQQYSTATLYGVTSAQGSATGGFVTSDANYYYHTFTASGTFTPLKNLTCDILVIAGGGGGAMRGNRGGGGGGAGGLLAHTSQSLTAQAYTVTVGGGGAGRTATTTAPYEGTSGSNSQFGSLTASVGGGGGDGSFSTGLTGGSGGGGAGFGGTGGAATSGQGFAGGNGSAGTLSAFVGGGGGGGAGAVGSAGIESSSSSTNGGNGGAGSNTYSSWATATTTGVSGFYAGGGGGGSGNVSGSAGGTGGTGGSGGGGAGTGVLGAAATAGTANTGGGGGGANNGNGASGGSGIVIIRYAK